MAGFELESILKYREYNENEIKNELGSIETLLKKEQEDYQNMIVGKDQIEKKFQHQLNHGATVIQCRLYFEYIEAIKRGLQLQKEVIRGIEQKMHQKREELITAMKDKKMMLKLKEKRLQINDYMEKRKQTAKLDDFSAGLYIRNRENN